MVVGQFKIELNLLSKILRLTKWKAFEDDKIDLNQNLKCVLEKVKNIVGMW